MVESNNKKYCAGNTLSVVLVVIIIISILSIAIIFSVGYTASYRSKEEDTNIKMLVLDNKGYEVLNDFVINYDSHSTIDSELEKFCINYIVEEGYEINFLDVSNNTITFKLRIKSINKCIQVTTIFNINSDNTIKDYTIDKWGITSWN